MKIRPAPMADLLNYLDDLYNSHAKLKSTTSIIELINDYYCSLTNHKTIMSVGNDFLNDWCDLNYDNRMENCPNVPGILIYKNRPNGTKFYGILYHSGHITAPEQQTNFLSYYHVHPEGYLASQIFCMNDWDGWGAPIRYFNIDDYINSNLWSLGERPLSLHDMGHDVKQLQAFLHKAQPDVPLNGYFEEKTLTALNEVRTWCNIPTSNKFLFNHDGQTIVRFLTNEYKS